MRSHIDRYLRTAALYDEMVALVSYSDPDTLDETKLRGKLDQIFNAGKIEGRLTAYHGTVPHQGVPEHDRLIDDWQKIVDSD